MSAQPQSHHSRQQVMGVFVPHTQTFTSLNMGSCGIHWLEQNDEAFQAWCREKDHLRRQRKRREKVSCPRMLQNARALASFGSDVFGEWVGCTGWVMGVQAVMAMLARKKKAVHDRQAKLGVLSRHVDKMMSPTPHPSSPKRRHPKRRHPSVGPEAGSDANAHANAHANAGTGAPEGASKPSSPTSHTQANGVTTTAATPAAGGSPSGAHGTGTVEAPQSEPTSLPPSPIRAKGGHSSNSARTGGERDDSTEVPVSSAAPPITADDERVAPAQAAKARHRARRRRAHRHTGDVRVSAKKMRRMKAYLRHCPFTM